VRLLPTCIVDDDVQTAKSFYSTGYKLLAKRLIANVAWNGQADTILGFDERDDLARVWLFCREIVARHRPLRARKR
jgi:hypothetical protein